MGNKQKQMREREREVYSHVDDAVAKLVLEFVFENGGDIGKLVQDEFGGEAISSGGVLADYGRRRLRPDEAQNKHMEKNPNREKEMLSAEHIDRRKRPNRREQFSINCLEGFESVRLGLGIGAQRASVRP